MNNQQLTKLIETIREETNDIDYQWIPEVVNNVNILKNEMLQKYSSLTKEQLQTEDGWLMGERIKALQTIAISLNDLHNSLDKLEDAVADME